MAGIEDKFPSKEFEIEDELNVQNTALVCFMSGQIIIMKERWELWKFCEALPNIQSVKQEIKRISERKRSGFYTEQQVSENSTL